MPSGSRLTNISTARGYWSAAPSRQKKFQVFVDRCAIEPVGSIAYRLAKVAGGDGDGTLTFRTIYEWDICAGVLMVEEAGGKAVDGDGQCVEIQSPAGQT